MTATVNINQDFASFTKAGITVVISSQDVPVEITQTSPYLTTLSGTVLIFAENISVSSSINLPGKTLGLFCYDLQLKGTEVLTIDVSGKNGDVGVARTNDTGVSGGDGGAAGKVYVSVQGPIESLSRLRIKALGGDGGQGGATTGTGKKGGPGGKGGANGTVMLRFNSAVHDALAALIGQVPTLRTATWSEQARATSLTLSNVGTGLPAWGAMSFYALLAKYRYDLSTNSRSSESGRPLASYLQNDLASFSSLEEYQALLQKSTDKPNEQSLLDLMDSELKEPVQECVKACLDELRGQVTKLEEAHRQNIESGPGVGGRGGSSADVTISAGDRGANGADPSSQESVQCRHLPAPGEKLDLDFLYLNVFPDQCRLLLNRADASFFANTIKSLSLAQALYERLIRRLFFISELNSEQGKQSKIYKHLEDISTGKQLCIAPLAELSGVLCEAKSRLARISLGQDMFGQGPTWVPRLSYVSYSERAKDMISRYKTLEQTLKAYQAVGETDDAKREKITAVRGAAEAEQQVNESRINAMFDENGPIRTSAYKIKAYDPIMKNKRQDLKAEIDRVASQIDRSVNVTKVFEAFSAIASSDSKAALAKNSAVGAFKLYQSVTTVQGEDGETYPKEYVVKQVTTCGSTLESLTEAVKTYDDGVIALEDPGALKIIASRDDINKMLAQFKSVLPEGMRTGLGKNLDDFLATVELRNNAVLEFNSTLQMVFELRSSNQQQLQKIQALSSLDGNKIDPALPSIINYLRKTRDDLAFAIMQELNFGGRAIRYWGLRTSLPLQEPGPLRGAIELEGYQQLLEKTFSDCISDYSGSAWSTWPSKGAFGIAYKLADTQLNALKTKQTDKKGSPYYRATITITPDLPGLERINANVRLTQVRLWLTNATLAPGNDGSNRRPLTINLTHTGVERIWSSAGAKFHFSHSPVDISFTYDCTSVTSFDAIKQGNVEGRQSIEGDFKGDGSATKYSIAPLGPFTTWIVTVHSKQNPGLDLSRVDHAWMEFRGRSKPFKDGSDDDQ
ncbi:hypothetical protein MMC26_001113 [Xylographa opegraphella]|nr:hypothetical protein [Xylographa opegraphella]